MMLPPKPQPKMDPSLYHALADSLCLAVLAGRRGLASDGTEIFAAWSQFVPKDGMGPIGVALSKARQGQMDAARALLQACPRDVARADLVADILEDLNKPADQPKKILRGPASLGRF